MFQEDRPNGGSTQPRSRTRVGRRRSRSTWTWSAPSARTATSCWWKPPPDVREPRAAVEHAALTLGVAAISNSYGGGEYSGETRDEHYVLQPPRRRGHGEFWRQWVWRRVPGGVAVRHGGRRHAASRAQQCSWMQRDGMEWRGKRLQQVRHEAVMAERQRMFQAHGRRRFRRCGSQYRRRCLRHLRPRPAQWRLARLRRHERGVSDHRFGLRRRREYGRHQRRSFSYSHTASLFDVLTGQQRRCGGSYLCTAGADYDGPTGIGSPSGIGGVLSRCPRFERTGPAPRRARLLFPRSAPRASSKRSTDSASLVGC